MTLGMSREEWASNAHKIALEQVSLEHSGTRVGDRGDACVTVTGPSSQLNTNRFLTSLGVESLTHALLTDDDNIVQDDASSAALFGALIGRHEDAQNGRALANDVFARILALRAAFRKLRRHANSQGNDDLTKVYTHAESRATEAIVSAVGTLKRRMPAAPAKDDKSNGQLHHATPAAPTNSLAERSSSAVDMNSPEAQMAGGGSAFDLADEATPHLFATVDAARSLRSFSIEPTTSTIIDQSTAEVISMAPLNVVRDYIAHRRTVALWMTNTASRALDDYITEKAVDLETRSTLDTERSKLLGMAEQIDAFIAGQQRERAEMEAERELRNELAAMERFAVAEAIAHEKALNKSLEHEVKELRARLQHLRNMITMGDARCAALAKKQQVLAEEQAAAEQSMASRLKHIDLAIRDGELRQWLTHLSCSFVSDLAAQAAQVNSDVLQRQESRLRALYGKVAESVADAMERSKDLVVRLSQGRNQLADFLGMSPLSTTSTVTDFRGATPVAPVTSMMTESIVSPDVTPGVQTPNASRVFDTANTNNNNSSFSSTDTVACGKDVLKVMSRIASAAEDLWNRLGDLTERWNKEELALGANTDACEKRMEIAYEHITTLIDATRGDVLEAAYGTRLPVTRSLDDVEDQSQAARKPRKGLPLKLARSIKPAVANGTPRHKADNGADATYLPTPPPPPTTSATVVIPRAAISDDTSQPRATWVAFVAQFRSAFGDGFLGF